MMFLEKVMKSEFEINAQTREDAGKGASRRLRRTAQIPGVVYGGKSEPKMISLSHNELMLHLEHEAFYSHILSLKVDGKAEQVILKDLQRHPAKPLVLHADFQRVSAGTKLRTTVPFHFIGEDVAVGVKKGGVVSHSISSVEVGCLPKDLPEFIGVDVSGLDIGDNIHLSELQLPEGVEILALAQGDDQDMIVVSVHSGHTGMDEDEAEAEAVEEVEAAPGADSES
jgi:large subunit ribosomal protein L25